MKVKIIDGMGNDEEINIESDVLTGKELLEKLDINLLQR